jgi:hypothetical protein
MASLRLGEGGSRCWEGQRARREVPGRRRPARARRVEPAQVAQIVRTGAVATFFGLLLSAFASMLGGLLGGRSHDPIGHTADGA